jgi:hypothetical protein
VLAQRKRLCDTEPTAPEHHDHRAQPEAVGVVAGVAHHADDLLHSRRVGGAQQNRAWTRRSWVLLPLAQRIVSALYQQPDPSAVRLIRWRLRTSCLAAKQASTGCPARRLVLVHSRRLARLSRDASLQPKASVRTLLGPTTGLEQAGVWRGRAPPAEGASYVDEAPRAASCPARRTARGIRRARATATRSERRMWPAAPSSSACRVRSSANA